MMMMSAEGHNFNAVCIENEIMKSRGNGVWYGIVVLVVYFL
jgi:hypothetical protein